MKILFCKNSFTGGRAVATGSYAQPTKEHVRMTVEYLIRSLAVLQRVPALTTAGPEVNEHQEQSNRSMKILFCKNSFTGPISGADEIAVTYAVELKAAGHSTGMLLVHPPAADDPLAARLRAANVPLTTL